MCLTREWMTIEHCFFSRCPITFQNINWGGNTWCFISSSTYVIHWNRTWFGLLYSFLRYISFNKMCKTKHALHKASNSSFSIKMELQILFETPEAEPTKSTERNTCLRRHNLKKNAIAVLSSSVGQRAGRAQSQSRASHLKTTGAIKHSILAETMAKTSSGREVPH